MNRRFQPTRWITQYLIVGVSRRRLQPLWKAAPSTWTTVTAAARAGSPSPGAASPPSPAPPSHAGTPPSAPSSSAAQIPPPVASAVYPRPGDIQEKDFTLMFYNLLEVKLFQPISSNLPINIMAIQCLLTAHLGRVLISRPLSR